MRRSGVGKGNNSLIKAPAAVAPSNVILLVASLPKANLPFVIASRILTVFLIFILFDESAGTLGGDMSGCGGYNSLAGGREGANGSIAANAADSNVLIRINKGALIRQPIVHEGSDGGAVAVQQLRVGNSSAEGEQPVLRLLAELEAVVVVAARRKKGSGSASRRCSSSSRIDCCFV